MVRQAPKRPPVSEVVGRWAKDASLRASGAMFSLLAAALALAVLSYSVSDPSWSTATAREATNWMGPDGAAAADVVLQMIGIGCVVLIAPVAMWGAWLAWRGMPERTPLAGWVRLYGAPVAALLIAGFASALPAPASWPFMTGLGGVLGDGVASALTAAAVAIGAPSPRGLAAAFALCLGAPLAMFAIGVRRRDLREGAAGARRFWAMLTNGAERAVAWRAERLATAGGEDRSLLSAALRAADRPLEADEDVSADEPVAASFIVERPAPTVDDDRPKRQILRNEDQPKPQSAREKREAQAKFKFLSGGAYELPPLSLLAKPKEQAGPTVSDEALEQNARLLEGVLSDFGVRGEIINVRPGPVVTLYELEPAAGVKSSRVIGLADDIARSMSAVAARVAVVPGRNVIGIELPNLDRETVYLRESLSEPDYEQSPGGLALALGKSIGGEPVVADLARMPHLLIAGTTGSGKSVAINTMILSLLYRLPPERCKLILIDPKMLELSVYEGIPHLLAPVVTDPKKAVVALKWTVREMEERYRNMSKLGVRNIAGFNERLAEAEAAGETPSRTVHTGYDEGTGEPVYETEELDFEPMPFIVVVIDEMADLMMVAGKDIEGAVQRLAQMARAAGIHLIMATQRPSVDVITGTIKANFPTRISFQVTSKIDSRTILGEQGGEQLLGQGDMLYMAGGGRLQRVHGPFVSDNEVERIVGHLKKQGRPAYVQDVTEMDFEAEEAGALGDGAVGGNTSSGDALYDQALAIVARDRKASTSYIQRRLQIGYNRAATLIERMENEGVVSPANHAGKREIFLPEPVE